MTGQEEVSPAIHACFSFTVAGLYPGGCRFDERGAARLFAEMLEKLRAQNPGMTVNQGYTDFLYEPDLPLKESYSVTELAEKLAKCLFISVKSARKRVYYAINEGKITPRKIAGSIRVGRKDAFKLFYGF